jgi:ABC-type molybdenum transport system ATPase subunit/photorepair protein PhrA
MIYEDLLFRINRLLFKKKRETNKSMLYIEHAREEIYACTTEKQMI